MRIRFPKDKLTSRAFLIVLTAMFVLGSVPFIPSVAVADEEWVINIEGISYYVLSSNPEKIIAFEKELSEEDSADSDVFCLPSSYVWNQKEYSIKYIILQSNISVEHLVIPDDIEVGVPSDNSFTKHIRKLSIGNRVNIENLGSSGICEDNTMLMELKIGDSASLPEYSFYGCSSLREVEVPATVNLLGQYIFAECESLESLSIASKIIPDGTFQNCAKLTSISIEEGVETIGVSSFDGAGPSSIVLPSSLRNISDLSFSYCINLTYIEFREGLKHIGSSVFSGCVSLERIEFPNSVSSIGSRVFAGCSKLSFISLGSGIAEIQADSFQGAAENIDIDVSLYNDSFYFHSESLLDKAGFLYYPYSSDREIIAVKLLAKNDEKLEIRATHAILMSSLVFKNEPLISSIELDSDNEAFVLDDQGVLYDRGKTRLIKAPVTLTSVVISGTVKVIDDYAFQGCSKLQTVIFENASTLKSINRAAFKDCKLLKYIDLPPSLTYIGSGAFDGCDFSWLDLPEGLYSENESIDFTSDSGSIYSQALFAHYMAATALGVDNVLLERVEESLNFSVKAIDFSKYKQSYIPNYAFMGLMGLEELVFPSSLTSVGYGSFYYCDNITDVYSYADSVQFKLGGNDALRAGKNLSQDPVLDNPSSFSTADFEKPSIVGGHFRTLSDINFYGLAYSENELIAYCESGFGTFVPIVILDDVKTSDYFKGGDWDSGYYNSIKVSSLTAKGDSFTPQFTASFTDPGVSYTRELVDGEGCSISIKDTKGNTLSKIVAPGMYIATIEGDNKSIFGTKTLTFTVAPSPDVEIPVVDPDNTGISASGSLLVPQDANVYLRVERLLSGTAFDALSASMNTGINEGVYRITLVVNDNEVHYDFGSVALHFPVKLQYNNHYVLMHHRHQDDSITREISIVEDQKASFIISDFSEFGIEIGAKVSPDDDSESSRTSQKTNEPTKLASTGDSSCNNVSALLAFLSLTLLLLSYRNKKTTRYNLNHQGKKR